MKNKIKGKTGYTIFTRKGNSQVVNELHHRIESAIERFRELSAKGYGVSMESGDLKKHLKDEDFKDEIK